MKKEKKFYLLDMNYKIYLLKVFLFFIYLFFGLLNALYAKDLISGYYFSEPSTQEIQDDDFLNPGFIWVEHGKSLWKKKENISDLSCNSCHGKILNMKGVALNFPKVNEEGHFVNLEQQINICREKKMKSNKFQAESKNLLALSALLYFKSKGLLRSFFFFSKIF